MPAHPSKIDGAAQRIESIEVLRFVAALLVVFVHVPTIGQGRFGFGVDIFFVISGYVMMLSTARSTDRFFLKRVIRVVPTYWIFTLMTFGIAIALPGVLANTSGDLSHLLKSLFFIPFEKNAGGFYPILHVGWTLNYEMFFYALFAISLLFTHRFRAELTTALIVTVMLVTHQMPETVAGFYSELIIVEFVFGMIVYKIVNGDDVKPMILIGFLAYLPLLVFDAAGSGSELRKLGGDEFRGYLRGIPAALIVFATIHLLAGRKLPRLLTLLGGASYALYLSHIFVIGVIWKLFVDRNTGEVALVFWSIVAVVASIAFSVVFFALVEKPLSTLLRGMLGRRAAKQAVGTG